MILIRRFKIFKVIKDNILGRFFFFVRAKPAKYGRSVRKSQGFGLLNANDNVRSSFSMRNRCYLLIC